MNLRGKRLFAGLLVVMIAVSGAAMPALAADPTGDDDLQREGDANGPQPYIHVDPVTIASHDMATMDSPLDYENDAGDIDTLPAVVNRSDGNDNPISYIASDVNASEFGEFPRKSDESDNDASALDASEWTTSNTTVSDVTTAPGVAALEVATDGSMGAGDTATATYSNFSITSDVDKRYVQVIIDVDTLDASADAELRLEDSDGDYYAVDLANASANEGDSTVVANSTGEGDVLQTQLGSLTAQGNGDGTVSEIQKAVVHVSDADATVQISALNAEKMGEWTFGEKLVDTDDDDELETETITDPHGTINVHQLNTLGETFDSAVIHDLKVVADFRASDVDDEDTLVEWSDASNYPGFDQVLDDHVRLELPAQYDVSYANAVLKIETEWPSERYLAAEVAEGTGDTDFEDISSWTDKSGSYTAENVNVTLDDTVQVGVNYVVHHQEKLTGDEKEQMTDGGNAVAGPTGREDDGNPWFGFGIIAAAVGALGALFKRIRG